MSENLTHIDVAQQRLYLAQLAGEGILCEQFQHQLINTKQVFLDGGPLTKDLFRFSVPKSLALVITFIDIESVPDPTDGDLVGDYRSTAALNPYGPLFPGGVSDTGQLELFVNDVSQFTNAWDIGVMGAGLIFVIGSGLEVRLAATPNLPVGKDIVLETRINAYITSSDVGAGLKKKETTIVTQVLP